VGKEPDMKNEQNTIFPQSDEVAVGQQQALILARERSKVLPDPPSVSISSLNKW
jgi:hypothetical protein